MIPIHHVSFNKQQFSELPQTKVNFTIKIQRLYSKFQKRFIRTSDGDWPTASTRQSFPIVHDANCAEMTGQVTCRQQPYVQAAAKVSDTETHVYSLAEPRWSRVGVESSRVESSRVKWSRVKLGRVGSSLIDHAAARTQNHLV
jgi:hypothetical protein